jgi:hypothetical protein
VSHFLSFGQRQGKDGHLFDDDLHGCVTLPAADPNFIFSATIQAMKIYYLHRRRLLQGRRRRHELVSVVGPTWSAVRHAGRRRRKRRVENIGQIVVETLVAQQGRRNAAVGLTTTWFHHSVRHNSHRFNAATFNVRLQIRVQHNLNSKVFNLNCPLFSSADCTPALLFAPNLPEARDHHDCISNPQIMAQSLKIQHVTLTHKSNNKQKP